MKKIVLLFIIIAACSLMANAQTVTVRTHRVNFNENTVVKDSNGVRYPYAIWKNMVSSGDYGLKADHPASDSPSYVLFKLGDARKRMLINNMPKPPLSNFFTTGEKIAPFSAHDIDGNKIKLKDLEGKVVVINFWFIGCPPCRQEIPALNKIALDYGNNPDIVFVAIALDYKYDIKQFIKNNPFSYHIIEDGRMYADLYHINLYPTNVILDKEGKVRFHSSGYALNTPDWIRKTIDEVIGK